MLSAPPETAAASRSGCPGHKSRFCRQKSRTAAGSHSRFHRFSA